jgi:hypothetical protein
MRRARVDLRCLLVVRDPRGVAHSWSKIIARPEIAGENVNMPRYAATGSALRWSLYSVLFEAVRLLRIPLLVVRYEDFISDPRATIEKILQFAGRPDLAGDLDHVRDGEVDLGVHHTVAGNPMRFQVGRVALRPDEDWRRKMPAGRRSLVWALTAPLRLRYGYRARR